MCYEGIVHSLNIISIHTYKERFQDFPKYYISLRSEAYIARMQRD